MERLSVVIANYNYEAYVGAAIDSALALLWPDVEVVVVDDGSTDGSLGVLQQYGERVTLLVGPNGGQRVAVNRGYAASTGDVVIFLDADDLLPTELPASLARAMTPAVSKVQFRMQRIDRVGTPIGSPFPRFEPSPSPDLIRRWVTATSAYPTPPGSGNAYARWFLDRIFPVVDQDIGSAADSACLAAAPFHGDVVTVPEVVVAYRQHGANDSDLLADPSRFAREVDRARARWRFAQRSSGVGEAAVDERPLTRSRELLQFRVAAVRTGGSGSLPGDGRWRLVADTVRSPFHPGPETVRSRLLGAGWCLAVLVAPRPLLRRLLVLRWRRG